MKKEFIPYEQALELKKLGFDELCLAYYDEKLYFPYNDNIYGKFCHQPKDIPSCSAILYQQAFRWFREKYELYAQIFVDDNKTFGFLISSFIEVGRLDNPIIRQFNSYDEAELGCIKQLIKIIDMKNETYN